MGLTSWKGDFVRKHDVTVAKNYLHEQEIRDLNRVVTMWLDYAEDQARRRKQVFLKDWESKLNDFLAFNERAILPNAGSVSKKDADARAAAAEFEEFAAGRRGACGSRRRADQHPVARRHHKGDTPKKEEGPAQTPAHCVTNHQPHETAL